MAPQDVQSCSGAGTVAPATEARRHCAPLGSAAQDHPRSQCTARAIAGSCCSRSS